MGYAMKIDHPTIILLFYNLDAAKNKDELKRGGF
jgi:hypothetical protein